MTLLSWYLGKTDIPHFAEDAQWRDVFNHILWDHNHRCAPGVLKELVQHGGEKEFDGVTVTQLVLYKAISNWDAETVSWIVEHHCPSPNEHLTRHWGSYIHHIGMVVFPPAQRDIQLNLLDKLLPIFSDNGLALDLAVRNNRLDCVQKLIPHVSAAFKYYLPYRQALVLGYDDIACCLEPVSDRIEALYGWCKMPPSLKDWDQRLEKIEQHWRNNPNSPSSTLYSVCVNNDDIAQYVENVSEKHRQQIFYLLCEQRKYDRAQELLNYIGTLSHEIGEIGLTHVQILADLLPHLTDETKEKMMYKTIYYDCQDDAAMILKDAVDLTCVQSMIESRGSIPNHMQKLDHWKSLKTKKNLLNEINTPNRDTVRKI